MAYDNTKLSVIAGNLKAGLPTLYSYTDTAATIATLAAADYFLTLNGRARVQDKIMLTGSDNQAWYYFTAVSSTTVTVSPMSDSGDIALAQGSILVGNASGVGAALDASTNTAFVIGNGTTITSAALTGDVTASNAGVTTVAALDLETATVTNIADTEVMIGTGAGTAAFASVSGDGTLANTGALTIGAGAITQSKMDDSVLRFTTSYFVDGKTTTAAWATNTHPDATLVRGYVRLVEVPDALATTITVLIQNATGTVSMTDTLTFTEGTNAIGATQAFTVITAADADEIAKVDVLNIITGGTTTTLGQVEVCLEWSGVTG